MMPQHFQLLDAHHEEDLLGRLRALEPHGWGLIEVELDRESLLRGLYRTTRLVAILPDGALIEVGAGGAPTEVTVTLAGAAPAGRRQIPVHLAIPSDAGRGLSTYAGEPGTRGARWIKATQVITDAYGTTDHAEVECVYPNAQLLAGEVTDPAYVRFQLAEVELSDSGNLVESEDYIPPCLAVSASPVLTARLARLLSAAGEKQGALAGRYQGRSTGLVEYGPIDMAVFWYLQTLNAALPRLMHFARLGRVHPERLYLALAELHGQLSTFEPNRRPRDIPVYDHLALSATFHPLFDQLHDLLSTVIEQRYKTIPLAPQPERGLFVAATLDPALLRKSQLYLIATAGSDPESLPKKLAQFIRVSSQEQIGKVVRAAVPGLRISIELRPPTAIPVKAENVYLKLQQQGTHWEDIVRTRNLAIFQPIEPESVNLELVAVEL